MLNNYKAWWTLLFIQCTMVALVLGAYFGMKANITSMKANLRLMNLRVQVLDEKLAGYSRVGGRLGPNDANSGTGPLSPPGQPADGAARSTASPSPTASTGNESSVCVNKMTHQVFSCENASKCLGSNNFDGAYFKGIRTKLALVDTVTMMICDEKGAENGAVHSDAPAPIKPSE